jgi:spore coat protein U-like protein
MKKNIVILMAMAIVFVVASGVYAGESKPTVNVSATVISVCAVSGTGTINFGTLDPITNSGKVDATGVTAPSIKCAVSAPVTVTDDLGAHETGTQARMTDGAGHYIPYDFTYNDSLTGEGPGVDIGDSATGHLMLAASIPAGGLSATPPNAYSDTITLTVSY